MTTYPGNGPSPIIWTQTVPGSDIITGNPNGAIFTATFNLNDGTTVAFLHPFYTVSYSMSGTCTGVTMGCGVGQVGLTQGATITGSVTGTVTTTPTIRPSMGVINAGAFGAFSSTAPGSWIEIFGTSLATGTGSRLWAGTDFSGNNAPKVLGGTSVTVGGQAAFVEYISPGQVNAQVPSGVGAGLQPVVVSTAAGGSSAAFDIQVNTLQPGLLTTPAFRIGGTQYVVALFADGVTYVLPPGAIPGVASRRARSGDTITLYGVGFGPVMPNIPAGEIVRQTNMVASSLQLSLGGTPASVPYSGLGPGYVGLYQFNVVVPNVSASDAVPLTFSIGGRSGMQTLFVPVQN